MHTYTQLLCKLFLKETLFTITFSNRLCEQQKVRSSQKQIVTIRELIADFTNKNMCFS